MRSSWRALGTGKMLSTSFICFHVNKHILSSWMRLWSRVTWLCNWWRWGRCQMGRRCRSECSRLNSQAAPVSHQLATQGVSGYPLVLGQVAGAGVAHFYGHRASVYCPRQEENFKPLCKLASHSWPPSLPALVLCTYGDHCHLKSADQHICHQG